MHGSHQETVKGFAVADEQYFPDLWVDRAPPGARFLRCCRAPPRSCAFSTVTRGRVACSGGPPEPLPWLALALLVFSLTAIWPVIHLILTSGSYSSRDWP